MRSRRKKQPQAQRQRSAGAYSFSHTELVARCRDVAKEIFLVINDLRLFFLRYANGKAERDESDLLPRTKRVLRYFVGVAQMETSRAR